MGAFQNIGVGDYLKRYGWKYGIQRGVFIAFPFHIVNDYENKKILYYSKAKKKLKKKYLKAASINPDGLTFGTIEVDNPIWVYWKQGLDQAPAIVKSCINSIKQNVDTKVIVITDDNVEQYVKFPPYVIEKLTVGTMSTAAFSDLLRFSLLEHYGGTWIDSTVYLTNKLPEYITKSDLFAYQDSFGLIRNPALMSVWLLHSTPNNEVIREARNIAFEYWKNQSYVVEYLVPCIILTMVLEAHPEAFSNIPYANSDYTQLMLEYISKEYDENLTNHILSLSSVHKLSYKLKDEAYANKESLYHRIVENILEGQNSSKTETQKSEENIENKPIYFISDYENRKVLYYHKVYEKLKKKYLVRAECNPTGIGFGNLEVNNPVWVYWKQGLENAPKIVQCCVNSICEHSSKKVIVLSEESSRKYVEFPGYILEKLQSGNMSAAAYSDLLRFSLLEHYGGTWIDATVFLTGDLPSYITESEFFAYQDTFGKIDNPAHISNWLLHCKPGNNAMKFTRNMAFQYWKEENYVMEYLFTYMLLQIALETDKMSQKKMPYANSDYCHLLLNNLDLPFDENIYEHIMELSNVHKLTYKLYKDVIENEGNFYNRIVRKEEHAKSSN